MDRTESTSTTITVKESASGEKGETDVPPTSSGGSGPTVPTTTKSSNNYLSSLSVNVGTLSPAFARGTANYVVDVPAETETIKISAKKEDSKAVVSGTGEKKLEEGQNTYYITVKAEDGKSRVYTIVINRGKAPIEEQKILLSALSIKGVTVEGISKDFAIDPEFAPEIYEYKATVSEDIDSLTINALSDIEDAIIQISGNENLIPGENIAEVKISSADGSIQSIYKIIVEKEGTKIIETVSSGVEEKEKNIWTFIEDHYNQIGIVIFVLAVICAVLGLIFAIVEYRYTKKYPEKYEAKKKARQEKKYRKRNRDYDQEEELQEPKKIGDRDDYDEAEENINDLFKMKEEQAKRKGRRSKGKHS